MCLILTSCETLSVTTEPIERPKLEVSIPEPLKLRETEWTVLDVEDKTYFALDTKGFENLAKNAEDVQNRLHLQQKIIYSYKEFYE